MNPYRFRGRTAPAPGIRASSLGAQMDGSTATLRLYDPIDSWGGDWGVSAKEFAEGLAALPADVSEIRLHLNSPGGEVFEAIAIVNMLRQHRARVVAVVDGLAASAASFIAASADETVMGQNATAMVHDAWGFAIGNAQVMDEMSATLGKLSDNIASIYAAKSNRSKDDWRALMRAETWFSAEEAVEAGLADRVDGAAADDAKNVFDLSLFAHAGRASAPAPWMPGAAPAAAHAGATKPPAEPAGTTTPTMEGADTMSDNLIKGLRERLGIPETSNLDEDAVLAVLDEKLAARAQAPEGTVLVEQSVLDGLRADAQAGRDAREQQLADARAALVDAAVADGRIAPARRDHWVASLTADPGAVEVLASLAKGTIPLAARGYTGGVDEVSDEDRLYTKAWGNTTSEKEA